MKVKFDSVEFELFDLEDVKMVEQIAERLGGTAYSWKTEGRLNWLEKGFSVVDVLGLTILSANLPDIIDLPDDAPDY
jgi:hypothetical protein